jgi:predicted transcriptional regulator
MAEAKNVVTIGVASLDEVKARVRSAFAGDPKAKGNHILFTSTELLWSTLNERRWAIVKAMTGRGPMSIREAARLVGRDVKAVHGDVKRLLANGVLKHTDDGRIAFPFDAIHVDFMLSADAA